MKIISKYKDYYDYLQGIYGVDEKLILDRTTESPRMFDPDDYAVTTKSFYKDSLDHKMKPVLTSDYEILDFYIADYHVQGMIYNNQVLFGDALHPHLKPRMDGRNQWEVDDYYYYHIENKNKKTARHGNTYFDVVHVNKHPMKYPFDKSPNIELNSPILLAQQHAGRFQKRKYFKSPVLSSYGISKVFSPHEIWILLSDWLGQRLNVPVPDNMTNKEKIQAAGFDLKTSFRKM